MRLSYSEIFEELCPTFIAYGMTYEQYWYGDPWMARAYAQAYLVRRKIENENMWIQGAYIANAVTISIANTFGKKKVEYLKKPLDIFPKTEAEINNEIREERRKLITLLNGIKRSADRKKRNTGSESNGKP